MKIITKWVAILALTLAVTSCANRSKQEIGSEVGLIVGTAVGIGLAAATGSDSTEDGMLIGAAVGAFTGMALGAIIGETLDEVDELKAQMATMTALKSEDGKSVRWESDVNDNVGGQVRITNTSSTSETDCKAVSHILNVNGKEILEEQNYCLSSDGSWVLQS